MNKLIRTLSILTMFIVACFIVSGQIGWRLIEDSTSANLDLTNSVLTFNDGSVDAIVAQDNLLDMSGMSGTPVVRGTTALEVQNGSGTAIGKFQQEPIQGNPELVLYNNGYPGYSSYGSGVMGMFGWMGGNFSLSVFDDIGADDAVLLLSKNGNTIYSFGASYIGYNPGVVSSGGKLTYGSGGAEFSYEGEYDLYHLRTNDSTTIFQFKSDSLDMSGMSGIPTIESGGSLIIDDELSVSGVSSDGTGKVVCIKSDGYIGTCSDQPNVNGTCSCS